MMKRGIALVLAAALIAGALCCFFTSCAGGRKKVPGIAETLYNEKIAAADEALQWAKEHGVAVIEDGLCTAGRGVWDTFFSEIGNHRPASVVVARYYTLNEEHCSPEYYEENKNKYPELYFYLIEYDGKQYTLKARSSKESDDGDQATFLYLRHGLYQLPESAHYNTRDLYVLTDDATTPVEEIVKSLFSSDFNDHIRFREAFSTLLDPK